MPQTPRIQRQIPDISITECHADNYKLKEARDDFFKKNLKRTLWKKNKKKKQHKMTKMFPSQKPQNWNL